MIGRTLSHYRITAPLGAGGMGVVYRAHDLHLERDVALKVLPEGTLADETARRRFRREALALSRLNHPHVATVYDFDTQDGTDFLVMELVEGEPLSARIERGAVPETVVRALGVQIAEALEAAHRHHVIHRDLKPANILVTPDGNLKVLDFGLARLSRTREGLDLTRSLTEAELTVGTVPYTAPEQLLARPVDVRVDLYSLGVVLYELATGRSPYREKALTALIYEILNQAVSSPRDVVPALSPQIEAVILRCLARQPALRYASARQLLADLREPERAVAAPTQAGVVPGRGASSLARHPAGHVASAAVALALAVGLPMALNMGGIRERVFGGAANGGRGRPAAAQTAPARSLAVLPFRNASGDSGQEYFTDGMTQALITALARAPDLLVLDQMSVSGYKNPVIDARKVGRELGADYLLEGSLQRAGGRLRVDVRLLEASTGHAIFSERLNREEQDLFTVCDEITRRTSAALGLAERHDGSPAESTRSTGPPTRNLQAYDLYLRANYLTFNNDTKQTYQGAEELLAQAVAIDPSFALAQARLGFVAAHLFFLYEPLQKWDQLAFVSISRAMSMDPSLSEPYVARATLVWSLPKGFQFDAALRDLLHAIELDPNNMQAHHWLGILTMHLGLYERAASEFRYELRLDPTNTNARGFLAWIETDLGRPLAAIEINERNPQLRFGRPGEALLRVGRVDEARQLVEADLDKNRNNSAALAWYGVILARSGEVAAAEQRARRAAEHLLQVGHIHHVEYDIARTFALLGRTREALDWLERTARDGMPNYTLFGTDPFLADLRGDPGFKEFLGRMKARQEHYLAVIEGRSDSPL